MILLISFWFFITVQTSLKMTRFDWIKKDIWKRRGLPVPISRMSLPVFRCLFNSPPCGVDDHRHQWSQFIAIRCSSCQFESANRQKRSSFKRVIYSHSTLSLSLTHTSNNRKLFYTAHTYCALRCLPFWPPLRSIRHFRLAHSSFFLYFVCLFVVVVVFVVATLLWPPQRHRQKESAQSFFLQATGKAK